MDSHGAMIWWILGPLMFIGLTRVFRPRGRRRQRMQGWGWGAWEQDPRADSSLDPEVLIRELEAQRAQMEELATRLSELENRADFAERLLSAPRERVDTPR